MSATAVGRRYASALFALARDKRQIERVAQDMNDVAAMWAANDSLRQVFGDPRVGAEVRRKIVRQLAQRAQLCETVQHALLLLSDRSRIRFVREIADAYAEISEQRSGAVRAEVISAAPLPEAYVAELGRVLSSVTQRRVHVSVREDPSLIGGIVTRIGDRVLDGSVRNQLRTLKERLLA